MTNNPYYHAIIRKLIISFGNLFSNIYIERKQDDSEKGPTIQTLQIPIAYSNKEKYIVRIDQDPNLENHVYTTLPRIAFEIVNYQYDASRKLNKNQTISCSKDGNFSYSYMPVPYNVRIQLYILTKTQEDALQILEQILPIFPPEYTLSLIINSDMNIIQDIPITITDINVQDEYDGSFQQRRFVTHTLGFTARLNLFGEIFTGDGGRIYTTNANITTLPNFTHIESTHVAVGDAVTGNVNENWYYDL